MQFLSMVTAVFAATLSFGGETEAVVKPCELSECLTKYVSAFFNHTAQMTKQEIHCSADKDLALCVSDKMAQCSVDTVRSLGKAVLSYIVFDRTLRVCPRQGYRTLYYQLFPGHDDDDDDDVAMRTDRWRFVRLLRSRPSSCAKNLDLKCLGEFVTNMKSSPNLCLNIPKKYQCLQAGDNACAAPILTNLLAIFPKEADKVLKVLCRDSLIEH